MHSYEGLLLGRSMKMFLYRREKQSSFLQLGLCSEGNTINDNPNEIMFTLPRVGGYAFFFFFD